MKKQKFCLNLSLVLIVVASLISATAIKANAGNTIIEGSSVDSSSFSGDSFNPGNSINSSNIDVSISLRVQANLNRIASILINEDAIREVIDINGVENIRIADGKTINITDGNVGENISIDSAEVSPNAGVITILLRGRSASTVISQIENILVGIGVSSSSVDELIKSIQNMISSDSALGTGIPVATKLQPPELVASNKNLVASSPLAQNSKTYVDINKLNAAINAYNQIIRESDAKTLKKLAANPEFMAIRNILNQFRAGLND